MLDENIFRICVTHKETDDKIGEIRGVKIRFINDKDFYNKIKRGELIVNNKVILFSDKSYTLIKKLIDNGIIKLDVRGLDKLKFMKLEYTTSLLDNSKYICVDSKNDLEKNKKINLLISLDYKSDDNNVIIPYELINKKYFVDNYDDIISSLGDGDLGYDYETHGLDMMNIDSKFEIIGIGICSNSIGYYIEFRNDNSIDENIFKEKYLKFIKDNHKRLWAYNVNFEMMVNYYYFGEFIELQDAMVLTIADENKGTLKYASQYYLKSIDWESETNHIKEKYIVDIYNSLSDDKKDAIYSIFGDVSKKHLDYIISNGDLSIKFYPLDYDFYDNEYESYKNKYMSSDGSTISYLPSTVVAKYCIYDCLNTLRIKELLYPQYNKAYNCYIKNIYLSIPLQNHGLLLDHEKLDKVSTKYEYILYNLRIYIAKFYYNYCANNLKFNVDDLITINDKTFYRSYGLESTLSISKQIVTSCIDGNVLGYLTYTTLYENILDIDLRTKIINLLESYKNDKSILNKITASSKIVKEVNYILNNYDDSFIGDSLIKYFSSFINNFSELKPKTNVIFLNKKIPQFNILICSEQITNTINNFIQDCTKDITFEDVKGSEIKSLVSKIQKEIKSLVKDYRINKDNIIITLDNFIKKSTIKESKEEFMSLLETYFSYELITKYKIGDNFYDKKTKERYFKFLNQLELNDYILVNSCNNQKELDELEDLTEEQKYKYNKIKFSQSFLNEYELVYNKSLTFYDKNIKPLLESYFTIEDIINNLISNKLLNEILFNKATSKDFNFIDYKKSQFNLEKAIKYYHDKEMLEKLSSIDIINILENDNTLHHDIEINLVTPENKQLLNKHIMNNYNYIIYNFHKIYKTGKFDISNHQSYEDIISFLESSPDSDDVDINTYVRKTFSLLPQMRILKYHYNKDIIENIDTSFDNNKNSFEECSKLMYCLNLYYKLDKVFTSYIHGNTIAKNTSNFDSIDEKGFSFTKEESTHKITQSQFKMLSLKTKRSSAGIHTLNKNLEPCRYLKVLVNHIGIYFDLSAAEVRAAAYMSNDTVLIELFESGIDIYNWMRESLSELIDRNGYKGIVLGLIYGRSSESIAKSLGHLNPEIVLDGINMFKNKFHKLWSFIESQTLYCIENGNIDTILGDKIDVSNYHKSKRSTVGMNYKVQGFTSSVVAEGGYNVYKTLYDNELYVRLINLVHDALSYSSHSKNFFNVYNRLNKLFIDYLYEKYGYLFKFDLDLFLTMSDKTSIKSLGDNKYELKGDKAKEIFNILNEYNKLNVIEEELIEDNRHIYQVIDNDKYIKTPQDLYIENDFHMYNKSRVIFEYLGE
jgi:hypothetical protein